MGGTGLIYYSAISQYASDHGICGDDFDAFRQLLIEMDTEYVAVQDEREREAAERAKASQP